MNRALHRKITNSVYKEIIKSKIEQVEIASNDLEGAYVAADVIDMETGEVLIEHVRETLKSYDRARGRLDALKGTKQGHITIATTLGFAARSNSGFATQTIQASPHEKLGRNEPCWCGSGKKFKNCHGAA